MKRSFAAGVLFVAAMAAWPQTAAARDFFPSTCNGTLFLGPQSAQLTCSQVAVGPAGRGGTLIRFTVQDRTGASGVLDATIESGDVARATAGQAPTYFNIYSFFTGGDNVRWPLQGGCNVSSARISCRVNDAVGGYEITAQF
jgi:hypothetical protein